jgi:hypothetical protein
MVGAVMTAGLPQPLSIKQVGTVDRVVEAINFVKWARVALSPANIGRIIR